MKEYDMFAMQAYLTVGCLLLQYAGGSFTVVHCISDDAWEGAFHRV